jgi:diguanylate cyclase (GGDEF)-like protein
MSAPILSRPTQSVALLIGIVLTIGAMFAHRFLPERTLTLDPAAEGAVFYVTGSSEEGLTQSEWVDQPRVHFRCRFEKQSVSSSCGYSYAINRETAADQGVDLSRYRNLKLHVRYTGSAHYVRMAIRSFDPRFSKAEDYNSPKFNALNLQVRDLAQPVTIDLREFTVPDWWVAQYDLPRNLAQPDMRNATTFSIYLQAEAAGSEHEFWIDKVEFSGDWISAEYWYLGILCIWLFIAASYGTSQWVALRRQHREMEREKDKYQQLSTVDALTKVLNRHGIEQFVAGLAATHLPTSVIVIDLDHFKKINDLRGHYVGDRVLQTVGEILRAQTRSTDGLGRWGGEEFVLVCPGASLSKAADLAEKLRHRILQTNFIPEDPISVTASFGVAMSRVGENFEDVFRQADQALYLAKSRGRNCVVAAADEHMHTVTGARKGTWALISGRFKLHK